MPISQASGETFASMRGWLAQQALVHGPVFWVLAPDLPQFEAVYFVGPEANKFLLHDERSVFSNDLGWDPFLTPNFGRALINSDGQPHDEVRKLLSPLFLPAFISRHEEHVYKVITAAVANLPEEAEVDVYGMARRVMFDIAAGALFGFLPGA